MYRSVLYVQLPFRVEIVYFLNFVTLLYQQGDTTDQNYKQRSE